MMNYNQHLLEYIEQVEKGVACKEQKALVQYVKKCFDTEKIYINTEQLEKYLGLVRYFPFERLFPWEEFLLTLWNCTYWEETKRPRWKNLFVMVGRGAGKDGFIAFDGACSISPYNPVSHYNVDICANNEDQATRPQLDLVEVLETPKYERKLNKHYYHTKQVIQGRKNKGIMKGHTNNPKGRDGCAAEKLSLMKYISIKIMITSKFLLQVWEKSDSQELDILPQTEIYQMARWMITWQEAAGYCLRGKTIKDSYRLSVAWMTKVWCMIKIIGRWQIRHCRFTRIDGRNRGRISRLVRTSGAKRGLYDQENGHPFRRERNICY